MDVPRTTISADCTSRVFHRRSFRAHWRRSVFLSTIRSCPVWTTVTFRTEESRHSRDRIQRDFADTMFERSVLVLIDSALELGSLNRLQCGTGLRVSEHFGNFFQRNVTDLEFGTLDADKALAALVKHEAKLDEKTGAFFQCAVLYTSAAGERLVRVHNIAVPVANVLGNVFRHADMDATITYESKKGKLELYSAFVRTSR